MEIRLENTCIKMKKLNFWNKEVVKYLPIYACIINKYKICNMNFPEAEEQNTYIMHLRSENSSSLRIKSNRRYLLNHDISYNYNIFYEQWQRKKVLGLKIEKKK